MKQHWAEGARRIDRTAARTRPGEKVRPVRGAREPIFFVTSTSDLQESDHQQIAAHAVEEGKAAFEFAQ